jgi:group I intron endonuclease
MINITPKIPIIGIYKITSPSGKVYIGQSVNVIQRKYSYVNCHKSTIGPKIHNSISKYGWEKHIHEIIEQCSLDELNDREAYWKQYFLNYFNGNWSKVLFCELYDRGGGERSLETRDKQSKALLGRNITWNAGRKKGWSMSENDKTIRRVPKSEITKQNMRKPRSEEAKKNMSYPKSETAKQNMKWERPLRECPYCNKQGKGAVMDRFHFNNCKNKNS